MKKMTKAVTIIAVLLVGLGLVTSAWSAGAQEKKADAWPAKAIQLYVPYAAGGDTDFNARTYAKYLEKELGKPVVVVNMAGNGGALAGRKVKDSPADGYTVLMNHSNIVMTELTGVADFGFEDFEVACTGAETCDVFIVKADSPFKTLKDLIEISKTGSEKVKIGGTTGSLTQLEAYSIISYGAVLNFVDVGSAAERLASLKGGHVQVIPNAYGTIKPYIESGEFRALGILSEQRNPLIPSIPTCKEQGYDIVVPMPYTFFFPKGTPKEITEKLSKAVEKIATTNKDYAQDIAKAFTQSPIYRNSEDALKHFRAIKARFTELRKLIK